MRSKKHVGLTLLLAGILLGAPGYAGEDFTLGDHVKVTGGERRMTFRLRGTTMREALQLIAETSNINLVLDDSVSGDVSLDFFQTPLNEILETLLFANGYRLQPQGRSYVVYRSGRYAQSVMRFVALRFVNASALLPTLNDLLDIDDDRKDKSSSSGSGGTAAGSSAAPAPAAAPVSPAAGSGAAAPGGLAAALGGAASGGASGAAGGAASQVRTPVTGGTGAAAGGAAPAAPQGPAMPAITPGAVGTEAEVPGAAASGQGSAAAMFRLSIKVDPRSNRFVLSGPLDKVNQAEELIHRLDVLTPSRVFQLNYVTAKEAVDVLRTSFFEGDTGNRSLRTLEAPRVDFPNSAPGARPALMRDQIAISQESPRFIPMPTQNALFVLGTVNELNLVEQVIKTVDRRRSQVLIKAQLVQMSVTDARALGLNYRVGSRQLNLSFDEFGNSGVTFNTTSANALSFSAQLNALIDQRRAKVLASPQLLAMDSRTSIINITDEIVDVSKTDTTVNANQTLTTRSITKRPIGITLELTPKIDSLGGVTMNVHPRVEAPLERIVNKNGDIEATLVSTREYAAQEIYVRDGETIVIGGLIRDEVTETSKKIPFLGDIPFLGGLFSLRNDTRTQQEVQIYITPEVRNDASPKVRA